MQVSDILKMNLTAREVISVLGLTCSPRTISKARRGMSEARRRINWDQEITLDTLQCERVKELHGLGTERNDKNGAEKVFFDTLCVWRMALRDEERGAGSVEQSIEAKTNAMQARALAGNPEIPNALAKLDQKLCKARRKNAPVQAESAEQES